jgi:hypothetical protein
MDTLRRPRFLAAVALTGVALAERGRRRDGGTTVYPASSALWAPDKRREAGKKVCRAGQRVAARYRTATNRGPP